MLDCLVMALSLEDRLLGCLLGQAVGDALGFPVEGRPPKVCAAYVDGVLRHGRAGSASAESLAFGQYTDDTQLARELVISYVDRQGFDPADYGKRIAAIFVEGRIVGRGRTTEAAARRLAQGLPWDEAGSPAPAVGNGSAMRAGPVGVLYSYDAERRKQVAIDQGRITHADPRAVAGSVAIASAVALAVNSVQIDRTHFVEALSDQVGGYGRLLHSGLNAPSNLAQPASQCRRGRDCGGRPRRWRVSKMGGYLTVRDVKRALVAL
jgi:ADP-ribosylglycohydrolase